MAEPFNLNINPYFQDFNSLDNYYQVLFRPGRPIQTRELNNLQAGLQNQLGIFGGTQFKEGQVVIPGATSYNQFYDCVQLNNVFFGISVETYIDQLVGQILVGNTSGVTAKVLYVLNSIDSQTNNLTIYIQYLSTAPNNNNQTTFVDGETLSAVNATIVFGDTTIAPNTPLASLIQTAAVQQGSTFSVNDGVYFIRNYFVRCQQQTLILDQYSTTPSYRIGFFIQQKIVTPFEDENLTDNAQGFNNYAAPGADRFQINLILTKKSLTDFNDVDFVEIARVVNGVLQKIETLTINPWTDELARRTYDESGNYYVKQFQVNLRESLNNQTGNNGVYLPGQTTELGLTPSDDLFTYSISPGKAYVYGYEVTKPQTTLLDAPKPRTTNSIDRGTVPFQYSNSFELNNITGTAPINEDGAILLLRYGRKNSATNKTIGVARVYDFTVETDYEDQTTEAKIYLYDIQTFTELTFTSLPADLSAPAYIEGRNSGASAYLYSVDGSTNAMTLYGNNGLFLVGESVNINGIASPITITSVVNYSNSNVKSVYYDDPVRGQFEADTLLNVSVIPNSISSQYTVTTSGTVISPSNDFVPTIVSVGDIITYSTENSTVPTYNVVVAVSALGNTLTVEAVPSVADICDGNLPGADITVNNLTIIRSSLNGQFNTLFTQLPTQNVVSVATTSSTLLQRYQVLSNIASSSLTISAPPNSAFVPYQPDLYDLSYNNGVVEPLSFQNVELSPDAKTLYISGLTTTTSTNAVVTTTITNVSVNSKIKTLNKCQTLIVDGSNVDTIENANNGLTYKLGYGLRVQDEILSVNVADVLTVRGVFQSLDANDPILPSIQITTITPSVQQIIVGERIVGQTSGCVATVVSTNPTNQQVFFVLDNSNSFKIGEVVKFETSSIVGNVRNTIDGSENISRNYVFDNGQRNTIIDIGRLILNSNFAPAQRKLLIVYDNYTINPQDSGSFVSASSYESYNYNSQIPYFPGYRLTDLLDFRPIVAPFVYNTLTPKSPFEFSGRTFNNATNSSPFVIEQGETLVVGYTYFLGRTDVITINSDGNFDLIYGTPSETPTTPLVSNGGMVVATIKLPPYLYSPTQAQVNINQYKRYQMADIAKLESRIQNLEYYTQLTLLESTTLATVSKDPKTGLDRFKCGFFVDNFKDHYSQDVSNVNYRAANDQLRGLLRPPHNTTSVDLLLGSYSALGIGTIPANQVDYSSNLTDLIGTNIQKTGQLLTLSYTETEFINQLFATRVENVTPFLVVDYVGNMELTPESDTWIDTRALAPLDINMEGNYESMLNQFNADRNTGLSPIDWGAWQTDWVGVNVDQISSFRDEIGRTTGVVDSTTRFQQGNEPHGTFRVDTIADTVTTARGGTFNIGVDLRQSRTGTQTRITPRTETASLGNRVVSRELLPFMRSRNIQFISTALKQITEHFVYFDDIDMSSYVVPKLLEIEMEAVSPSFIVGETVVGAVVSPFARSSVNLQVPSITFRVATSNHRYGPFNAPTDIFTVNPYNPTIGNVSNLIPSTYSSTSSILNVDTESLQLQASGQFFGFVETGMILVGQTSGARCRITTVRLISDNVGTLIGSLFLPDPTLLGEPKFASGTKTLRLTSSRENSRIPGLTQSSSNSPYYAAGQLDITQESTLSIRFADVETTQHSDTRTISSAPGAGSQFDAVTGIDRSLENVHTETTQISDIDPVAQTFYVDENTPIYITSVDLYFYQVDNANIPVTLQIRTVTNGYPTDEVLPFGEVSLTPNEVNVSDDSTVPTRFTFPSPVILDGGNTQYAIVVKSASNNYLIWVARLGETDVSTLNLPESQRVIVSNQPALGSLFKSGNGSTWTADQYEDLKFKIYKAQFTTEPGTINFYNPSFEIGNNNIINLKKNPLMMFAKTNIIQFPSSISGITTGVTIYQEVSGVPPVVGLRTSFATVNTISGRIGTGSTSITTVNVGAGYSPGSYTGIALTSLTGNGYGGVANITVNGSGEISSLSITDGGNNYTINDTITVVDVSQFGGGYVGVVTNLGLVNSLNLTNVQGNFNFSSLVYYFNPSTGSRVNLPVPTTVIDSVIDGLHMQVYHGNHNLHDTRNYVTLKGATTELDPTSLTVGITTATNTIGVASVGPFATFEGSPISVANPGYALIENEIISYTGVSTNALIGTIVRGIDGTSIIPHDAGAQASSYQLNGISLRRINTTFQLDDAILSGQYYPQLNYYYVKIDTTRNGVSRNDLFFINTGLYGGNDVYGTQNIQFEAITPNIQVLTPTGTKISTRIRTVSGTSIGYASSITNLQPSFIDQGYQVVTNQDLNYLSSPALMCNQTNELQFTSALLGSKSFNLELGMITGNPNISPCLDLDRVNVILTSNRLDHQISDFARDSRVNSLNYDPSAAIYISQVISLKQPATALQVMFAANRPPESDIRCLYRIITNDNDGSSQNYQLFPGYDNLDNLGNPINPLNNNGLPDVFVESNTAGEFRDYQFTASNLPSFTAFAIKIVMVGNNQATPPILRDLRGIALA